MPLVRNRNPFSSHYDMTNKQVRMVLEPRGYGYYEPGHEMVGFSLTDPEVEETAPTYSLDPVIRNGVHYNEEREIISALPIRQSQTVGFPPGKWLRTALSPYVKPGSVCTANVWVIPTCTDACGGWFMFYPESSFSYLSHGNMIEVGEDGAVVDATATITTVSPTVGFALEAHYIRNIGENLQSVAIRFSDCAGCDAYGPCATGAYGGDIALAVPTVETTDDNWATGTAVTTTVIPVGHFVTRMIYRGDILVVTHTDDLDPTAAVAGGIAYSIEGGALVAGVGAPVNVGFYGVTYADGYFIAVGQAGNVYRSLDGINWAVTASGYTTDHLMDADVDVSDQTVYVVGITAAAADSAWTFQDGVLVDISANLPGGGAGLYSVAVLGPGHIMIGGTTVVYENAYWPDDPAFRTVHTIAGDNFRVVMGDRSRQIIAGDAIVYERSVLTDRTFTTVTIPTATGNWMDGQMCYNSEEIADGPNYFVLVSMDGDIALLEPCEY